MSFKSQRRRTQQAVGLRGIRRSWRKDAQAPQCTRTLVHHPIRDKDGVTRCLWCGQETEKGDSR